MRKAGIILSLLGITLAALALIFASGYQPKLGFLGSLPGMEVVLRPGVEVHLADEPLTDRHTFFQWEDAGGKTQTSNHAPAATTVVKNFRVTSETGGRWSARPGRTRAEVRGRKAVPLRHALALSLVLLMVGIGQLWLSKAR